MTQIFENIALAIAGLRANKMRALLTMLGIIIGISSVIMITTLGDALQNTVTSTFDSLGANSVQMYLSYKPDVDNAYYTTEDFMTDDMLDALRERFPDQIEYISLNTDVGNGVTKRGIQEQKLMLLGVTPGTDKANAVKMVAGRFITDKDVKDAKYVVAISDTVANAIFHGTKEALGQEMSISTTRGPMKMTVVGVYKFELNAMMMSMMGQQGQQLTTYAFIPDTRAKMITGEPLGYHYSVTVGVKNADYSRFATQATDFLNRTFYKNNPNFQVTGYAMQSMMDQMNNVMGTVKTVISVVAAISLLVGGIGVMNIMLVSVTERTREIGVRKALGAPNSAIRIQFIVESVIICLIGGIIGILFGLLLGNAGAVLIGSEATASPSAIVIAVLFSMAIGIFFGYYPANKAARLDPIEALRYE